MRSRKAEKIDVLRTHFYLVPRSRYKHNVDKTMVQLKFEDTFGAPLGVINWYAVHATSMNNTNQLVSSDNVGYASVLFEQRLNPDSFIGKVCARAFSTQFKSQRSIFNRIGLLIFS